MRNTSTGSSFREPLRRWTPCSRAESAEERSRIARVVVRMRDEPVRLPLRQRRGCAAARLLEALGMAWNTYLDSLVLSSTKSPVELELALCRVKNFQFGLLNEGEFSLAPHRTVSSNDLRHINWWQNSLRCILPVRR